MTTVTGGRSAKVTLPADDEILVTREFDAPKHLVYRAWTEPELVRRWWTAKRGTMTVCDMDVRVGGTWRWVMTTNEGSVEVAFSGEYLEIVPDEKIVSTEVYEAMPGAGAVNSITLTEHDGRTTLEILTKHQNKANRDAHIESGMEDGLQDALDLMADAIASLA
jgi:uncharacterized protein YndB with AHSA1/START domain